MQGLWLENRSLSLRADLSQPELAPGWALIHLRMAGICSTDLEMVRGYYPFTGVPGHEFVGEVAAVGDSSHQDWVGRRVVGEINFVCNECTACTSGRRTHCECRTVLGILGANGVFAESFLLPVENLHAVPDGVPDEAAVFTEPLAAALEILDQGVIRPSDHVLLVGAGRLGLLVAQVLSLSGCALKVVARREAPRRLLTEWGIPHITSELAAPGAFDVVIEASGSPEGFEVARRSLRPRGILVLKSTYAGNISVNLSSVVVDELTLLGSRCGPFEPAIQLLQSGRVDPRPLVARRYSLTQGLEAFAYAAQPGILKVLLTS